MSADPVAFAQFRRLLVGIVVEILHETHVDVDISGLTTTFTPESGFRFLWFDNWMRFCGVVRVPLRATSLGHDLAPIAQRVRAVWPEIIGAISSLPLADRLSIVRNETHVGIEEGALTITFDLEAD